MSTHLNHMLSSMNTNTDDDDEDDDDDDNDHNDDENSELNDAASAASMASSVHQLVSPEETSLVVDAALESHAHAQNSAKCETDDRRRIVEENVENKQIVAESYECAEAEPSHTNDHQDDDDDAGSGGGAVLPSATQPGVVEQVDNESDGSIETTSSVNDEHLNSADGAGAANSQAKFTSLVMITQQYIREPAAAAAAAAQVNIVPSDTTHIVSEPDTDDDSDSITVRHTNRVSDNKYESNSLGGYFDHDLSSYFTRSLESDESTPTTRRRRPIVTNHVINDDDDSGNAGDHFYYGSAAAMRNVKSDSETSKSDDVTVVTGTDTLSAVVCLEDGLADDDSWVEEGSAVDEEEFVTTTGTDSDVESAEELTLCAAIDREEELRGYNRASIDFTLHTIVEESCEESELETNDERKNRVSASELEKYFFFGLGGNGRPSMPTDSSVREDSVSETSSLCSDGMDSINFEPENTSDLASSRLEKYFLTTFMGFSNERNKESDGSGSVGSDSDSASPEQRRKRLVRARGTPRSHNSSLDNLLAVKDDAHDSNATGTGGEHTTNDSNQNSSSETDTCDEPTVIHLDKLVENPNDTLKRKKSKKKSSDSGEENRKSFGMSDDELPSSMLLTEYVAPVAVAATQKQQKQSRDSGFIGSNDDLLKGDDPMQKSPTNTLKMELEEIKEADDVKEMLLQQHPQHQQPLPTPSNTLPPSSMLTRKDSNNWSSDEETNLMMSKMRQFFKTLVASNANAQRNASTQLSGTSTPLKTSTPVARPRVSKFKSPQLLYFENELTRLMKTVPGINDDQVRSIVEYLSSEDTSYDSSDYTSSDLEGATAVSASTANKSELQEQISASCQQIIKNFEADTEGDMGDGGLNPEAALVYQKLMASFCKLGNTSTTDHQLQQPVAAVTTASDSKGSPPIFAKVMSHIGTRLVALMHEVSSGESHTGGHSPKPVTRYHKKLQQKISATTTDDEDDDSTPDTYLEENLAYMNNTSLPRSKSHDLLSRVSAHHLAGSSGEGDAGEDEERISWRGSFESALLADSRTKLDRLFNQKSLSREQLDRVRSCGSIGAGTERDDIESSNLWTTATSTSETEVRRLSVPRCQPDSSDEDDDRHLGTRSTLPRSLQTISASTNSLPRLSTANVQTQMQKSQSVHQFVPNSVKSARYRPPGFNSNRSSTTSSASATVATSTATPAITSVPKKTVSSLGLTSLYTKRDSRTVRRIQTIHSGKKA